MERGRPLSWTQSQELSGSKENFSKASQQTPSSTSLAKSGSHAHPELIIGQSEEATMISLDSSGFPLPSGLRLMNT